MMFPSIQLLNTTPAQLARLSAAFWEAYAVPLIEAQNEFAELLETVELPVSHEDLAAVVGGRRLWIERWRALNQGAAQWIDAAEGVNTDTLTDDELDQVQAAFTMFQEYRNQALEANDELETAYAVWLERAWAMAPRDSGIAAELANLARQVGKAVEEAGESVDLWPLVPLGLGALALFWFFGRPGRR